MCRAAFCVLACLFVGGCRWDNATGGGAAGVPVSATAIGPHRANGTILDAATGRRVAFVDVDGLISGAAADGDGGWFIAGDFTTVDGRPRAGLAHIDANGSLDARWRGPRLVPPAALGFVLLARIGSRVLVAGTFHATARRRPRVVALRAADGSLDRSWATPRACIDGDWAVLAQAGRAYVATGCAAPPCIVALAAASGRPLRWSPGIDAIGETGCVNGMALAGDRLFFTGGFTAVGRRPRPGMAAVRTLDGRVVPAFAPSGSCAQDGHAIAVAQGLVFVGGDGCPAAAFAASDGHQLWAWPRRGNSTTSSLLAAFGRVYVGGAFTRLAGGTGHGLVALDQQTGRAVRSWHPAPGSTIESLSLSGGRILVGAL